MTPYGYRLEHALNAEYERMRNEWFFKWHHIGGNRTVNIDGFDGRQISYSGIRYEGSPRAVYWATLSRYLRMKVDQIFTELEREIRSYGQSEAGTAIADCELLLSRFTSQIGRTAEEKDRVLRGDGLRFPPPDAFERGRLAMRDQINARAVSLRRHLAKQSLVDTTQFGITG